MKRISALLVWIVLAAAPVSYPAWVHGQTNTNFSTSSQGDAYFRFSMDEDRLGGAPDQSALNHPLTASDRVIVKDRHFYTVGPDQLPHTSDDKRLRFFGVNLSFSANFPEPHRAVAVAKRLRKLGVNAVRLHHMDSFPDDSTVSPRSILTQGPYPTFNKVAVSRLKTFIQALSAEGIYINLNLRVGYRFRPLIDGLPDLDNGQNQPSSVGTPIHVYYPPLIERQARYARELIQLLGLEASPALGMVEINNESSLLAAWQGDAWYADTWRNAIPSAYSPVLQEQWKHWILQRYGTLDAACKAWNNCNDPDASALPVTTLSGADSATPSMSTRIANKLSKISRDLGWSGVNPDAPSPEQRYKQDFISFLTEMDRRYFNDMKAVIREAAKAEVPVTGTQMTYGGIMNLESHRDMDYIDDHIYVGHHVYANGNPWQSTNWRVQDISASGAGLQRLLGLSLRRDYSKPFVVSEFNQPFPTPGGSEILPLMAAVASLQDWDGIFFYRYDDSLETKEAPWYFSLSGDWGKYALMGQSSLLFRRFLIPSLTHETPLPLTPTDRLFLATQGHIRTLPLERHLKERFGLPVTAALRTQLSQHVLDDDAGDAQLRAISEAVKSGAQTASGTQTLRHFSDQRYITLDAPRAWGVFGRLQPGQVVGNDMIKLRSDYPSTHAVQILVTPLDQRNLKESAHWLVTLGGDTTGTQPGSMPPRPKALVPYPGKSDWLTLEPDTASTQRSGMLSTKPPSWQKHTPVELCLPYTAKQLTIYPLNGEGQREKPIVPAALTCDGPNSSWLKLQANAATASTWYEVIVNPINNSRTEQVNQ